MLSKLLALLGLVWLFQNFLLPYLNLEALLRYKGMPEIVEVGTSVKGAIDGSFNGSIEVDSSTQPSAPNQPLTEADLKDYTYR